MQSLLTLSWFLIAEEVTMAVSFPSSCEVDYLAIISSKSLNLPQNHISHHLPALS